MYESLFPAFSVSSCKFPCNLFFLITNQYFVVLFALIILSWAVLVFSTIEIAYFFEESYIRAINNFSMDNSQYCNYNTPDQGQCFPYYDK